MRYVCLKYVQKYIQKYISEITQAIERNTMPLEQKDDCVCSISIPRILNIEVLLCYSNCSQRRLLVKSDLGDKKEHDRVFFYI